MGDRDRDSDQYVEVGDEVRALVERTEVPGTTIELGCDAFVEAPEFSSEGRPWP